MYGIFILFIVWESVELWLVGMWRGVYVCVDGYVMDVMVGWWYGRCLVGWVVVERWRVEVLKWRRLLEFRVIWFDGMFVGY